MPAERSLFDIELKSVRYAAICGGLRRRYQPPRLRAFWEILSAQAPHLAKAGLLPLAGLVTLQRDSTFTSNLL
jgi:hypothetical protein